LKIALVDDEKLFLGEMESLCQQYSKSRDIHIELSCFSGGKEFISSIGNTPLKGFQWFFLIFIWMISTG